MKNGQLLLIITFLFIIDVGLISAQDFSVYTSQQVVGSTWYLEVMVDRLTTTTDRYANAQLAFQFGSESGLDFTNPPSDESNGWTNLTASYGTPIITTTNFGSGNTTFPKYIFIRFYNIPAYSCCLDWASQRSS